MSLNCEIGLGDISSVMIVRISSAINYIELDRLAVNFHHLLSNGAAFKGGGWGETPYMIVKRFGCIAIHNKSAISIIHSFIH